jgi:hypothetical protein
MSIHHRYINTGDKRQQPLNEVLSHTILVEFKLANSQITQGNDASQMSVLRLRMVEPVSTTTTPRPLVSPSATETQITQKLNSKRQQCRQKV